MALIRSLVLSALVGLCLLTASTELAHARHLTAEELEAIPNAFPVSILPPNDATLRPLFLAIQRRGYQEEVGKIVSIGLSLGALRVPMSWQECGEANAFYTPKTRRIALCYEFVVELNQLLGRPRAQWYKVDALVMSVMVFIELHEMGHALLDRLNLPFSGREEDIVDHFAVLMMSNVGDASFARRIVEAPAAWFHHHGDRYKHDPKDVHSADNVRAGEALCLLYGRYREPAIARELSRSEDSCITHYEHVTAAWNKRLAPYTRLDSGLMFK